MQNEITNCVNPNSDKKTKQKNPHKQRNNVCINCAINRIIDQIISYRLHTSNNARVTVAAYTTIIQFKGSVIRRYKNRGKTVNSRQDYDLSDCTLPPKIYTWYEFCTDAK